VGLVDRHRTSQAFHECVDLLFATCFCSRGEQEQHTSSVCSALAYLSSVGCSRAWAAYVFAFKRLASELPLDANHIDIDFAEMQDCRSTAT
jgi:hypothetical protein